MSLVLSSLCRPTPLQHKRPRTLRARSEIGRTEGAASQPAGMGTTKPATEKEKENWLLSGWERSKYDEGTATDLGVIINKDKVVVVTGAARGIGYAITKKLCGLQCHVFGSVRKREDGERLQAEFQEFFTPLLFDVTDEGAVAQAAAFVRERLQGHTLLGLVNNAGWHSGADPLAGAPLAKLRQQFEVNVIGHMVVAQAFLPLLGMDLSLEGEPGCLINMASIFGGYGLPFSGAYGASKAAIINLSETLRRELTPFGIRVACLLPGPIETEIWDEGLSSVEKSTMHPGYAPLLERVSKWTRKEMQSGNFFLPASAVADATWKALRARHPPLRIVVTRQWLEKWWAPTTLPTWVIDRALTERLGLNRLLPRTLKKKDA